MSTPILPDSMTSTMKQFETMTRDFNASLPKELRGAANLMAHPVGALAAGSALGLGLASQAFGLWMGTLAGAAEASQRLFMLDLGGADRGVDAFRTPASPMKKASAAVETMIADAETMARDVAETVAKAVEDAPVVPAVVALTAPVTAFLKPAAISKPEIPDDLKAISGVGPKLEKVLNDLGVWTFAQIAAWGDEQVGWVDDYLSFRGRIARDKWIEQAGALAKRAVKH